MLPSGTAVGRYVVLDRLGEGAMGEIYRAWDNGLDRVVALKLLLPLRAESPAARKRFHREARLSARINHPCVAHVYDVGEHEESPFIAMEFVPGRQLRSELGEPMDPDRVVFLARQILEGLAEAHRQGVVHRDLKPENILIAGRDQVKLVDFGLAKQIFDDVSNSTDLSHTGLTGTPRYMAPEQIQGGDIDARTDLYSLGCVLYEMVAGRSAHQGNTLGEMLMSIVSRPVAELLPEMCPPPLAAIIKQVLEKKPEQRFQDAEIMLAAVRGLSGGVTPPPPGRATARPPHPRAAVYAQRGREALTGVSSSSSVAIDMLAQAIELDPEFALAHAMYAEACAALFNTGHADATWLDRAQASLEKAESLDPTLPDLRVARARIVWNKTFNFPAETALRELRWALRSDPNHIGALRLWATITAHVGLLDHAEAAIARAQATHPHDEMMRSLSASMYIVSGHPQRALDALSQLTRLDPNHEETLPWWVQAQALTALGRLDEADAAINKSLRRRPADPLFLSMSALTHALRGNADESRRQARAAEQCIRAELHPHHAYHLIACAESVLGDVNAAHHWLKRTAEPGATLMRDLGRRFEFFRREFPLDDPATMSFVATEVGDGT